MDGPFSHSEVQARELREAAAEVTMLRDLLTDLWNHARVEAFRATSVSERLWARVEAVVTEGQYGWDGDEPQPSRYVENLARRVARIEEILRQAAVVSTRDV